MARVVQWSLEPDAGPLFVLVVGVDGYASPSSPWAFDAVIVVARTVVAVRRCSS